MYIWVFRVVDLRVLLMLLPRVAATAMLRMLLPLLLPRVAATAMLRVLLRVLLLLQQGGIAVSWALCGARVASLAVAAAAVEGARAQRRRCVLHRQCIGSPAANMGRAVDRARRSSLILRAKPALLLRLLRLCVCCVGAVGRGSGGEGRSGVGVAGVECGGGVIVLGGSARAGGVDELKGAAAGGGQCTV